MTSAFLNKKADTVVSSQRHSSGDGSCGPHVTKEWERGIGKEGGWGGRLKGRYDELSESGDDVQDFD